jgi:hypothetical protein
MTAGTLRRIERECGELMAYFGYVPFQAGTDEQPARNA